MLLNNIRLLADDREVNVKVSGTKITAVLEGNIYDKKDSFQLTFKNVIAFPGLVNSHDHLDFNSFPQFGNKIYKSYSEWGIHIHEAYKKEIAEVLKIPSDLRTQWGVYKNLICGVTTVVNHGAKLKVPDPLITVFQECNSLHSVKFEKFWRVKLNHPFNKNYPYVIHSGEGTDEASFSEIDNVIRWNLFKKPLIGIHGVAMDRRQANHFKAMVWCPASNYFLFNRTAPISELQDTTNILFGTDSTLTAGWNIWEHLRLAGKLVTSNQDLLAMLTTTPSMVWGWPHMGRIEVNCQADIVIARNESPKNFSGLNPADIMLVLHRGEVRLFDEELYQQLVSANYPLNSFHKIFLQGTYKYVQGDLPGLIRNINRYHSSAKFPVSIPN